MDQQPSTLQEHLRQHASAMSNEPAPKQTEAATTTSTVPQTIKTVLERSEGALERAKSEKAQTEEGRQVLGDMRELVSDIKRMEEERHVSEKATRVGQLATAVGEEMRESPAATDLRRDVERDVQSLSDRQRAELPREKADMDTFVDHTRFVLVELARSAELRSIVREFSDVFSTIMSTEIETAPKMEMLAQDRDRILNRLRIGLLRVSSSEHYKRAIFHGSALLEQLQHLALSTLRESQAPQDVDRVRHELQISPNMQNLIKEAKGLAAAFAGGDERVLDNISRQTDLAIDSTIRNRDFHQYIQEWRSFVWDSVISPDRLDEPEFKKRGEFLLDKGKPFFRDNRHMQELFREIQHFVDCVKEDPLTKKLIEDQAKLIRDMAFDEKGTLVLKQNVLDDLRRSIVPVLTETLKDFRMNDIHDVAESALGSFEYEISNIKLSALDILPEYIYISLKSKAELIPKELESRVEATVIKIVAEQINLRMRDVKFWYRRMSIPHAQDAGSFDVTIPDDGLEVHISADLAPPSVFMSHVGTTADKEKDTSTTAAPQLISVRRVTCTVHRLYIQFFEAKFAGMYNILSKLFSGSLKRAIARRIAENILAGIEMMDRSLSQVVASLPAESARDTLLEALKKSAPAPKKTGKKKKEAKREDVKEELSVPTSTEFSRGYSTGRTGWPGPEAMKQQQQQQQQQRQPQFESSGRTLADWSRPSPYQQYQPYEQYAPSSGRKYEERPYEQRTYEQRPHEQRPYEQRPYEQRPYEQRPYEQRPYEQWRHEQRYPQSTYEERSSEKRFWPHEQGPFKEEFQPIYGQIPSGRQHAQPPQQQYRPRDFDEDVNKPPMSLSDLASKRNI